MANRLRAWGPAAAWAAVLFFLSSIPDVGVAVSLPIPDKVAHAALYVVLGAALVWGRSRATRPVGHALLLALGALYGVSDEWHQSFVPGRTPDVADWIADVVGLALGYGTTLALLGRKDEPSAAPLPGGGSDGAEKTEE